jgi:hypothetical protein
MKRTTALPQDAEAAKQLKELLALSLHSRREAVADDVRRRAPKYSSIAAHDLADALALPEHWRPDDQWSFTRYARIVSAEEYAQVNDPPSELVYLIEDAVEGERFHQLLFESEPLDDMEEPNFAFLTKDERSSLERAIAERQLEAHESNGMNCIGRCSMTTESGAVLEFEGEIEDDGACLNLRTPYDKQAKRFVDLSFCITSDW